MTKTFNGHVSLQLEPGEACVVLEKKFWDHMVMWYGIMARDTADPVEKANWNSVATAVRSWVNDTYFDGKVEIEYDDDDDNWN